MVTPWRVMLPLVWPGLVTVAPLAFPATLIVLGDKDKGTLPVLMTAVRSGRFGTVDCGAVQAGGPVMMIPCVILVLIVQRHHIRGLTAGAVKRTPRRRPPA